MARLAMTKADVNGSTVMHCITSGSLPHGDSRAIYVGDRVEVAFACASRLLQAWSGPPAKAPYFIPGPLLNRHS